ncbi:Ser/Thr protein phosphatase, putative [Trichomonas vaginalis G3]|uniref:Ser/Thr protein phosphatase, putative n=1 Tax=Trichomonas vaginalis (strain ATCC PRA-98 / G3) TaxID=412133 RepID=A2GAT9_TRIV3|nr:sphingomyelin catabolic process [Trichomonas vaginalis G3]EAX85730.1 Ser/Thr protein phosphatase, putative [Trichomonas vaginalis G3]KAI5512518.1 sphingomyelin catabolic process [Trichomonas vaginalis G3]|eukprot:XP_001298660.1 Ser/Thr protein phosphatase [Trichomonas vaginalis G3]
MSDSYDSTEEDPLIEKPTKPKQAENKATPTKWGLISYIFCAIVGLFVIIFVLLHYFLNPSDNYFIYFNDIHIDHEYVYTKSRQKNCHENINPNGLNFTFGQYGCEAPHELVESFFENLKNIAPKPKFIVFGGDSTYTWTYNHTYKTIQEDLSRITTNLKNLYPKVPFILNLGNAEYDPNYGGYNSDIETFMNTSKILGSYLTDQQRETFEKGGYYYYDYPKANLRVISLNSVIYSKRRNLTESDLYGQISWLKNIMNTEYKTLILFHIQPGVNYAEKKNSWYDYHINQISQVFEEKQPDYLLGAHVHLDMLMPFFNSKNLEIIALSNPAVSPKHDNNPSFRLYYMNKGLSDYKQFYADIKDNPSFLNWELEYQFTKLYEQSDLSQKSLKSAVKWISTTSKGMWTFLEHVYSRGFANNAFYQCMLGSADIDHYNSCVSSKPQNEILLMKN